MRKFKLFSKISISAFAFSFVLISCGNAIQDSGQVDSNQTSQALQIAPQTNNIRVGMWNIANYEEKGDKFSSERAKVLADVLYQNNLDLLTVIEPTYKNATGFTELVKNLNHLAGSEKYEAIISLPSVSEQPILKRVSLSERYGFIYKKDRLRYETSPHQQEPADFSTFNITDSPYDKGGSQELNDTGNRNILFFKEKADEKHFYTRRPGAIKWTDLVNNQTFVTIAAHASSPDARDSQGETKFNCADLKQFGIEHGTKCDSKLGSNEAWDALKIPDVLKYFSEVFKEDDIFFMADTNIRFNNNFLFERATKEGYKNIFPLDAAGEKLETAYDKDRGPAKFRTTLSSPDRLNAYANAYDKAFYKFQNYNVQNPTRWDLWNLYYDVEDNGVTSNQKQKILALSYPEYDHYTKAIMDEIYYQKAGARQPKNPPKSPVHTSLKELISDHTMVHFELQLKK
ncbi:hypothetical protein J2Z62_000230 [Mycoplasmoides fastidiosum]|uniref:Uncharacterized protein n=1 Tax=Mycoplasmoides fastidiosum TaxID=92758 RepID=A0ABU0LYK8_9BACT|nr:hypothetical protein [Mycoplasmoides fastidiosum]MDQ0513792.1 hypothetical protein [Mycoplasmoides fastidiosum]UUD37790.1 hypothetical protein NPA10_00100 [Mycoplasmoides fastidiosum]